MLVITGLHTSQVQYFELAKCVAKLRATKIGDSPLLPKTGMETGQGGNLGRLTQLQKVAQGYAFMLDLLGVKE